MYIKLQPLNVIRFRIDASNPHVVIVVISNQAKRKALEINLSGTYSFTFVDRQFFFTKAVEMSDNLACSLWANLNTIVVTNKIVKTIAILCHNCILNTAP